jgi:hypothetical protein
MRSACPSGCEAGTQRPLQPDEVSQLSSDARSSLVLLRKQGWICDACGSVYVSSRAGTIYLEKLSVMPQVNVPYSSRPSSPRMRFLR